MAESNEVGTQRSSGGFGDDLRQAFVVMKNEIKKFVRGKKIILFTALIAAVMALMTVALFMFADHMSTISISTMYVSLASLIVLMAVTLFSSTSLVSEFEERTALILFTKPIRKWSIYVGKLMASLAIMIPYLVAYYLFIAVTTLVYNGDISEHLWTSLGFTICYALGATGIALVISSIMKKGSTASIMTFMTLLLLLDVFSICLSIANVEPWWMFDQASGAIMNCFNWDFVNGVYEPYTHAARDAAVMLVWGVVTSVVGFLLFRKRDF